MTIQNSIKSFIFMAVISDPLALSAQSIQVFGGGQSARNCFSAATIAAQTHYASTEDIRECTYALEHTLLRPQDRVATLVNRGVIYVALEEYDKAIQDYDKAYIISPNVAEIHVNRGNMLFMSRYFDQAVNEYTLAIEMKFTKEHIARYNRGLAYEKMGDLARAAADYRRALELMPDWKRAKSKLDLILNQTKKG